MTTLSPSPTASTSLYIASQEGNLAAVRELLESGANVDLEGNTKTGKARTPLHAASKLGHLAVVQLLLDCGVIINRASDKKGRTPIHTAAKGAHLEVVRLLLERGVLVDMLAGDGFTPLHISSRAGHLEVVKLLMEHGADVSLTNSKGRASNSAIGLAAHAGHLEVVQFLLSRGAIMQTDDVLWVAAQGHQELLAFLLKQNLLWVNIADIEGITPLIAASQNGHIATINLLLDSGASIDATSSAGVTALFFASAQGQMEAVKLLLDRGAAVDVSKNSASPLMTACLRGNIPLVKLLERGATGNGFAVLVAAAGEGHLELVKLLLEIGMDVDAAVPRCNERHSYSNIGYTSLHEAARQGNVELVKLLLEKGANSELVSMSGKTALQLAINKQHFEVVNLLLEYSKGSGVVIGCESALIESLRAGKMTTAMLLLQLHPQLASTAEALHLAAASGCNASFEVLKRMIELGSPLDLIVSDKKAKTQSTALHLAILSKQLNKVRYLVLHGADTSIPLIEGDTAKTVSQLCGSDDKAISNALLLHFWTPQTHVFHPKWVRDAVNCMLLISKRQRWPFDQLQLYKIISFVAFGWYKSVEHTRREQREKKAKERMEAERAQESLMAEIERLEKRVARANQQLEAAREKLKDMKAANQNLFEEE